MLRSFVVLLALAGGAVAFGCKEQDNPKANFSCGDAGCGKPPISAGGAGNADASSDGSPSDAAADALAGVTATGKVVLLQSDDFATSIPFGDPAKIRFEGADGIDVSGDYDGVDFAVPGAASGSPIWAAVIPNGATALPTLQPADTASGGELTLSVVPASTIDLIYGFLNTPQNRVSGAAHVVLHFIDSTSGNPVPGVVVTHQGEAIAYDAGGTWTESSGETGEAGYAVVANVATAPVASKQIFKFASAAGTGGVELLVEADSVTLADVLVGP